ncbi:peptidoglycan editing factor PgeF [bacterium]|nr:peptidoglycan editing factor PgeF [bacterium]MBU1989404.1 peptidoglycan editing factor PgeF [bacterium]
MKISENNLLNQFKNITCAFTDKEGGVSLRPYSSLNLAFHVGDDPRHVQMNHTLLAQELGYEKISLVHMKQIHSERVHVVDDEDRFENPQSCDALVTNKKNTPLMVMVADCTPLLFYDDAQKVIAVAHAGRAGAFKNIVHKTLEAMACGFRSRPENIYVTLGASIGVCCYEVGAEIYDEALGMYLEYAVELRDKRYYLDINRILHSQLLACGIREENIEISKECTCCNPHRHFSYRAEGTTGRSCGIILMN